MIIRISGIVLGLALLFAPLIFKAPSLTGFNAETFLGLFILGISLFQRGQWEAKRAPIILLALSCFLITHYMAAFQLGYFPTVWEPFFTPGTRAVLTSNISKAFPISDAGLGSIFYGVEAIFALTGRTILLSACMVVMAFATLGLLIMQPLVVGTWCTLCLITAFLMLLMILLSRKEMLGNIKKVKEGVVYDFTA